MKLATFTIAALMSASHAIKVKDISVEDLGFKTATKIAESINPTVVYKEEKDMLPETIAPSRASTLERRGVNIPANPIYDLETTIESYVLPEKKHHIISGYNGADEDEIMDKIINEYAELAKDSYGNKLK